MRIRKIRIENYRQFEDIEIAFDKGATILAGANNSGKTSLISLIKSVFTSGKKNYTETDIPTVKIKKWIDEAFEIFKSFYNNKPTLIDLDGLIEKMQPENAQEEGVFLETTRVSVEVEYDREIDDIMLYADYIMDLDGTKHGFYFQYCYELNKVRYKKALTDNFDKLMIKFSELSNGNEGIKEHNLKEMLIKIYVSAIMPVCYFCDEKYDNRCKMGDIKEFTNLFNFTFIKASRPLDDEEADHTHNLSKQMLKMVKQDEEWQNLISKLPGDLLKPLDEQKVTQRVKEVSLTSLKDAMQELEKTNGGQSGELMLGMNIQEDDISDFLQKIIYATYDVDGYFLNESSQGLGYSNMIYMHLQLNEFSKSIDHLRTNIAFIEEPESHMHPQMQRAFMKYLLKFNNEKLQLFVTTHSSEMVRIAGMSHIRVIRKVGKFVSELYNLDTLITPLKNSDNKDEIDLANFYEWSFEIGFSDIVFADKAILYEGDTERLLIRNLLSLEKYNSLAQQYIAYVQVGGAYAYKYKALIELLKIKTLILTDLDYDKKVVEKEQILESTTTNATIKNFYYNFNDNSEGETLKISNLYRWINAKDNITANNLINLSFQTSKDQYARTLEEVMLCNYFKIDISNKIKRSQWLSCREKSKLNFSIPRNRNGEVDSEFSVRDILNSSSSGKTDFMYSVILNKYVENMEPNYIREGLLWLAK